MRILNRNIARMALVACLLLMQSLTTMAQTAIGQWRDWISFSEVHHIEVVGNKVYAAGNLGLMSYDKVSEKCESLTKSNGLSDVGVSTMAYDEESGFLVVAYKNASIDLLKDGKRYTIADIKRADLPSDKTIYNISFRNNKAYVACGFGVVVLNLERIEIENSYYLGEGGTYAPVYDIVFVDDSVVVATDNGLLQADASDVFLNILSHWRQDESVLSSMKVTDLEVCSNKLYALTHNGVENVLFRREGTSWEIEKTDTILGVRACGQSLVVCYNNRIGVITSNGEEFISQVDWYTPYGGEAVIDEDGVLWTGHNWAGLVQVSADRSTARWHKPQGPETDNVYKIVPYKNKMMICPGGHTTTYANSGIVGNVNVCRKGVWQQIDKNGFEFYDVLDVAVNPKDSNEMLAASWGGGIVRIVKNKVKEIYTKSNTNGALEPYTVGDYSTLRTGAVCFDKSGNAWMTNSLVSNGLVKRTKDSTWESYNTYSMIRGNEIDKILYDTRNGYLWMLGKENLIYVHDGKDRMAIVSPNNGSRLTTSRVSCMVQDADEEIWLGTDKGIKIIFNTYNAFANGGRGETSPVTCNNVVMRGEFDEYVMHYENISCMAVDGANRKWIGTHSGGLYLLSSSGQEQIEHFTSANSPLFSDKIICVEVNPESGEVFVGTDVGIQVYRGTATKGDVYRNTDIHAYPNPVKPDYDGVVAIKGFSTNAMVHITDVAGHVVYSTTANGGQAIWPLTTNEGQRVSSGVYYVFGSDAEGGRRVVTKILVIKGE